MTININIKAEVIRRDEEEIRSLKQTLRELTARLKEVDQKMDQVVPDVLTTPMKEKL